MNSNITANTSAGCVGDTQFSILYIENSSMQFINVVNLFGSYMIGMMNTSIANITNVSVSNESTLTGNGFVGGLAG